MTPPRTFVGTIVSLPSNDASYYWGFIDCEQAQMEYGDNVGFRPGAVPAEHLQLGTMLEFEIEMTLSGGTRGGKSKRSYPEAVNIKALAGVLEQNMPTAKRRP